MPFVSDHSEDEESLSVLDIKPEQALSISERTDRSSSPERDRLAEEAAPTDREREASSSPAAAATTDPAAATEPPSVATAESGSPPPDGSPDRPTDGRSSVVTPPDPAMFVSAEIKSEPGSPRGEGRKSPSAAGTSPSAAQPPFIAMLPGLQGK